MLTYGTIRNVHNGLCLPNQETVEKMAGELGVSPDSMTAKEMARAILVRRGDPYPDMV